MRKETYLERDDFLRYLYQRYHKMLLLPYAMKLCANFHSVDHQATDLLQNFYEKTLQHWMHIQLKYRLQGVSYLFKMLRNAHIDMYRKRIATATVQQQFFEAQASTYEPEEITSVQQLADLLPSHLLMRLSKEEYQILAYRIIEDLSYEQIAFRLCMPINTVGTHLHRAKQKLRAGFSSSQLE